MRVLIVEDHLFLREFLIKICSVVPNVEVVADVGCGFEAIDAIVAKEPNAMILDIGLPDIDGFEVLARMKKLKVHPKVLVISSYATLYLVFRLDHSGVNGFLDKCVQTAGRLKDALVALDKNRPYFTSGYLETRATMRSNHFSFDKMLTKQQMSVLELIAKLRDDVVIGAILCLAPRTVESHRTAIMRKLGVHSRIELIRWAREQGFR
jgi:DNA-binding NarL/FixJ family response regulator